MNTLYFLRHAKTRVDEFVPVSKWGLSEKGYAQAREVANKSEFQDLDAIITSEEDKAFFTAKPLADVLGKIISRRAGLNELDRDKGGFMSAESYEETIRRCLTSQGESVSNWETADHALSRVIEQINSINREYQSKKILIVGHGLTLNLYFAHLLGKMEHVVERLHATDFCDWGIVEDGKVVKDLGK